MNYLQGEESYIKSSYYLPSILKITNRVDSKI